MWLNISAIFKKLSHDPNVRAVLLTGAGERAFTAGLDVQAASEGTLSDKGSQDGARKANGLRRHILEFQDCITDIEKCEKRKRALSPAFLPISYSSTLHRLFISSLFHSPFLPAKSEPQLILPSRHSDPPLHLLRPRPRHVPRL
jgi:hypothetical protein